MRVCSTITVLIEKVKYCFYIRGSCLYTKGHVDGWLHDIQKWDEKFNAFNACAIRHGMKQKIETLINEESLLMAMYLRNEKTEWTPSAR